MTHHFVLGQLRQSPGNLTRDVFAKAEIDVKLVLYYLTHEHVRFLDLDKKQVLIEPARNVKDPKPIMRTISDTFIVGQYEVNNSRAARTLFVSKGPRRLISLDEALALIQKRAALALDLIPIPTSEHLKEAIAYLKQPP